MDIVFNSIFSPPFHIYLFIPPAVACASQLPPFACSQFPITRIYY
nr:MAG TPA: hypothetical protein [Caudoviricetes sp.]